VIDPTLENVKRLTEQFFKMHWNTANIQQDPPSWSDRYTFIGSLPNYDKQGVYIFAKQDVVTYIGVGTSTGGGRYAGHGLGNRFQAYTRVINDAHAPTDARLIDAGSMFTIGFSPEHAYLANALELYLIGRLMTEHNIMRPGRGKTSE
jgi:hypothetical protein